MKASNALRELRRYAERRYADLSVVTAADAVELMAGFYRDVRAAGCDVDGGGDRLLLRWRTHDWGAGERFEFDVTRELRSALDDEELWQLHLTLSYEPTPRLRVLGSQQWSCRSVEELADFLEAIRSNPAYGVFREDPEGRMWLRHERLA